MATMNIRQTPIGQHIKWYNNLMITKRITFSIGGRLRLMSAYSGAGRVINQEEATRLIENQEDLVQSINTYLQLGTNNNNLG